MLLLVACSPPGPAPSPDGDEAFTPTPWVYEEPATEAHVATPEELEEGLDELVATLLRINPLRVHDAFEWTNTVGDAACPIEYPHNGQTVVSGDCTAASGYTWLGYALINRIYDRPLQLEDGMFYHHVYSWSTGLLRVLGPDGFTLEVLGDDLYREYDGADGDRVLEMYLWGDFYAENSDYAAEWLGEAVGVQLYLDAVVRDDGNEAVWDGGLSRLQGFAKAAVLHELTFDTTAGGCPTEPAGAVDLFDAEGIWYTVTFDGDTACDGCGEAHLPDGTPLGTVCTDLAPLGSWDGRPW